MNSSLSSRIRNGTLLVLLPILLVCGFALPDLWRLGGAIRGVLQENYISIASAQHMQAALQNLQVAELEGDARPTLPGLSDEFSHWLNIEMQTLTEIGEPETARDIEVSANTLFAEIASAPSGTRHDAEFDHLTSRLNFLIRLNENALWRNDKALRRMGQNLISTLGASLVLAVALSIALSVFISRTISRPLTSLASQFRKIKERKTPDRLRAQELLELQEVATNFNQMADQLEYYERLNVERLLFEKSKIEGIVKRLQDGLILIDSEGKVAHINEIGARVIGVAAADTTGQLFETLPSNAPSFLRIREELRSLGKEDRGVRRIEMDLHLGDHDRTFLLNVMPMSESDRVLGILLILQDVTYIRDQDRARANLVATLSHELRTPLTSLGLAAQLLEQEQSTLPADRRKLLGTILSEFSRLTELTDELLDLTRGRVPSMRLRQMKFNLGKLIEDFARRFSIQADEKHIKLETSVGALPDIYGDPMKISFVISNLLANAIRYTPQEGVVRIAAGPASSAMLKLEVSDTGPGIAPEIREHIFERFAQYVADGHPPGSAGLGLAIAKEIVNAHGGRIFVESTPGHGSKFIVELPIEGGISEPEAA